MAPRFLPALPALGTGTPPPLYVPLATNQKEKTMNPDRTTAAMPLDNEMQACLNDIHAYLTELHRDHLVPEEAWGWQLDPSSSVWTATAGTFALRAIVRPTLALCLPAEPPGPWPWAVLIDGSPVPLAQLIRSPQQPRAAPLWLLQGVAQRLLYKGNEGSARRFRPALPWRRDAEGLLVRVSSSGPVRVEPRSFTAAVKSEWAAYCYEDEICDGIGCLFLPCAGPAHFGTAEEAAYSVTAMVGRFL